MRKIIKTTIFIMTALISFCIPSKRAFADTGYFLSDKLKLSAECSIIMEADSRRVLYASNSHSKRAMASTTKIMTALAVIENCDLDDTVTIPIEAQGVEGSSIYLTAGEKLTVKELLYGLMLQSGNDAAVALAIHCSGSISEFANLMNETAERIGALNSHFVNPNGLPNSDHYTTAYDLALIAAKAMEYDDFREIVSTTKITIRWGDNDYDRVLVNKNKMLMQYEGADGIKTGYTVAAGRCLVASATRNGMTLIAVVLNCSPMYADCTSLLDFGFSNYEMSEIILPDCVYGSMNIEKGFISSIEYKTEHGFSYPLKSDDILETQIHMDCGTLEAPVKQGSRVGYVSVSVNGQVIADIPLVLVESTDRNTLFARFGTLMRHAAGG